MTGNEMVPTLMFMTLGVALLAGIGSLIWFLRKRRNREAYVDAFQGGDPSPDQRLPRRESADFHNNS